MSRRICLCPGRTSAAGAALTRWQACAHARPSTTGAPQNDPEAPPGLLQTNTRQPSVLCGNVSMAVIAAAAADVLVALKRWHASRQAALGIAILTESRTNERMILYVWFLTGRFHSGSAGTVVLNHSCNELLRAPMQHEHGRGFWLSIEAAQHGAISRSRVCRPVQGLQCNAIVLACRSQLNLTSSSISIQCHLAHHLCTSVPVGLVQCSQHLSMGLAEQGLVGRRLAPRAILLQLMLRILVVGLQPPTGKQDEGAQLPHVVKHVLSDPMIVDPKLAVLQTREAVSRWLCATKRCARHLIPRCRGVIELSLIGRVAHQIMYNPPHVHAPLGQLLWKRCNGLVGGIRLLDCSEGASQRLKDNINASKDVVGLRSIACCCQRSFALAALVLGSCMP
jgi:hypothetical protein